MTAQDLHERLADPVTPQQLADALGVDYKTALSMFRSGQFPVVKMGSRYVAAKAAVLASFGLNIDGRPINGRGDPPDNGNGDQVKVAASRNPESFQTFGLRWQPPGGAADVQRT